MGTPRISLRDYWAVSVVNVTTGVVTPLTPWVVDLSGWVGRGATAHRLESADLEVVTRHNGARSPAADALDLTGAGLQLIRITPDGDADHALWGLLLKTKEAYTARRGMDTMRLSVAPVEYLLHSRVVYYKASAGALTVGINATATPVDDYLKDLVDGCTSGVDPEGNSRAWDWGTLAIQADASAAPAITVNEFGGHLDEVLDAHAKAQGCDWELRPTISAGAVTFTFSVAYPRGGTDRTALGDDRVILNDFAGMAPEGERYFDREQVVTVPLTKGIGDAQQDSASFTLYGRWELITQSEQDDALEADISRLGLKIGSTYTLDPASTDDNCRWMTHYEVGDKLLRNNVRLDISEVGEELNGMRFSFEGRKLKLEARWGNKEPGASDKKGGGRHRPSADSPVEPAFGTDIQPVGNANASGAEWPGRKVYEKHVHLLSLTADDAGVMPLTAGVGYLEGFGGITTAIVSGKLRISGAALVGTHNLLSATHPDTTAASVVRGDVIVGQGATPKWARLALGASGTYLRSNGTDALWATIPLTDIPHTHGLTYTATASGGQSATHNHVIGYTSTNSSLNSANHNHVISFTSTNSSYQNANHNHVISYTSTASGGTSVVTTHDHNVAVGNHTVTLYYTAMCRDTSGPSPDVTGPASAGTAHTHSLSAHIHASFSRDYSLTSGTSSSTATLTHSVSEDSINLGHTHTYDKANTPSGNNSVSHYHTYDKSDTPTGNNSVAHHHSYDKSNTPVGNASVDHTHQYDKANTPTGGAA